MNTWTLIKIKESRPKGRYFSFARCFKAVKVEMPLDSHKPKLGTPFTWSPSVYRVTCTGEMTPEAGPTLRGLGYAQRGVHISVWGGVFLQIFLLRHWMLFHANTDLTVEVSFPESDGSRIYLVTLGLKYLVFCFGFFSLIRSIGRGKCLYMNLLNNFC